jgi:site-specific DNA-methyltransferase (adenine-specific)
MSATLLHGDCLEIMKTLPDKSVDCVICDLPYGQLAGGFTSDGQTEGLKKKLAKQTNKYCDWDIKINLEELWTQIKRLVKNNHTPVLFFCNTKFGFDLYNSNPSWYRYDLVWNKERGISFLLANKMPMKSHEMIYVFSKAGAYYKRIENDIDKPAYVKKCKRYACQYEYSDEGKERSNLAGKRCPLSVLLFPTKKGVHPTEKPIDLYKWLLERYCPEGGTVLDPTAGSFNSILVAKELGLKGIGIEKDDVFYETATKKFKDTTEEHAEAEVPQNEVIYS